MLDPHFLERMYQLLGDRIDLASKIVTVIAAWPTGELQRLTNSGLEPRELPLARDILQILAYNDIIFGTPDRWERNSYACTPSFAAALQGAAVARRLTEESERPIVAATIPHGVSALASLLPSLGLQHAVLESTDTVFADIARSARDDLTIFAPFLNEEGALWVRDLVQASPARQRSLIVRNWARARRRLAPVLPELAESRVRIYDYFLQHADGYETFHAKLVVADDTRAYVGSANFLRYRKNSLDLGVIVKGRAAQTIRFVSEAMKRVSQTVSYDAAAYSSPASIN